MLVDSDIMHVQSFLINVQCQQSNKILFKPVYITQTRTQSNLKYFIYDYAHVLPALYLELHCIKYINKHNDIKQLSSDDG